MKFYLDKSKNKKSAKDNAFVANALLIYEYFKYNLMAAMEYRASFFIQIFGMALNNLTFVFFWDIAFKQIGGTIGGYEFADVMFIWGLTSTGFGLAYIIFANQTRITEKIITGELDSNLLQPKSVLINLLASQTSLSAWGDFIYGFLLVGFTQQLSAGLWAQFVLYSITAALMITSVSVLAHTLTFYIGNASMISGMALEFIINFNIYPIGIFPYFIRLLLYTLLPAGFMVHLPLRLVREFNLAGFALVLAAAASLWCISHWFFNISLKKYESGNLIQTRM